MLLDLINIGVAVGIVLPCGIAALHVISYALPVPGRNILFLTHPINSSI